MMRRSTYLIPTIVLTCSSLLADTTLYVAPSGKDSSTGTREAPLATLAGARDRVRQVKAEKPDKPIHVAFGSGTYLFKEAVQFTAEDSGSEKAPIAYRAWPGAKIRFTGGVPVTDWKPVTDQAVLDRLPEGSRSQVRVADLKAQGITDYGKLTVHGFAKGSQAAEAELFYDDEPMTLARWPNEGFRGVEECEGVERVKVDTDRIARWTEENDPWVFAYWHHDWAELHEPIVGIDAEAKVLIRSEKIKPQYGVTKGRARWYAYNLLSELDEPGEFYVDRDAGRIYFWPPTGDGRAVLSQSDGIIRAENLSHVTFRGFTVEGCRATAIVLKGGTDCHVVGCTIRNVGHRAVVASGGTKHEVYGCDVYHCGHTIYGNVFERCHQAVFIGGGDDNIVTNNVFHECRRAAHIDNRGMGWQKAFTDDPNSSIQTRFRAMPVDSDLWKQRYPTLAGTLDDEPNIPKRNVFARNVSAGGTWNHITAAIEQYQRIEDNLVFDDDADWVRLVKDDRGQLVKIEFKDPAAVKKIGFKAIPVDKIGVYEDERRASWPVVRSVRVITLPK